MRACKLKKFVDRIAAEFELASIRKKGNDVWQEAWMCRDCSGQWHIGVPR